MLLFYYQLQAAATDMASTVYSSSQLDSTASIVIFTDQTGQPLFDLPLAAARNMFGTVADITEDRDPEDHDTFKISIGEISHFSPGIMEKIAPQLTSCFNRMAEAQNQHNEKLFFSVLREFFEDGFRQSSPWKFRRSWTLEERIQICNVINFLGLRFTTKITLPKHDFDVTGKDAALAQSRLHRRNYQEMLQAIKECFSFNITSRSLDLLSRDTLLPTLKTYTLPTAYLKFDTVETFQKWIGETQEKIISPKCLMIMIEF